MTCPIPAHASQREADHRATPTASKTLLPETAVPGQTDQALAPTGSALLATLPTGLRFQHQLDQEVCHFRAVVSFFALKAPLLQQLAKAPLAE